MFKVNYEFRKGILFIRLKGNLTKSNKELIAKLYDTECSYIALNLDEVKSIDIYGIKYISNLYKNLCSINGSLVLCDKNRNISTHIFNNQIPYVVNEIDLLKTI